MTFFVDESAIFYIACGKQYISEAVVSAESARRLMPSIATVLFTDSPGSIFQDEPFSYTFQIPSPSSSMWFLDHVRYMVIAMDSLCENRLKRAIFVDTDTYFCDTVYELFDMLDKWMFAGAHAPGRFTTKTIYPVPSSFPEINIGVNPTLVSEGKKLWQTVFEIYEHHQDTYGNNDQGPLRDVLWGFSHIFPFYVLPPEYNLRFNFPCFASRRVKILHGHSDNMPEMARRANITEEMRSWIKLSD